MFRRRRIAHSFNNSVGAARTRRARYPRNRQIEAFAFSLLTTNGKLRLFSNRYNLALASHAQTTLSITSALFFEPKPMQLQSAVRMFASRA